MDDEQKEKVLMSGLHALIAIPAGWLSLLLGQAYGKDLAVALGAMILLFLGYLTQKLRKKDVKWWLSNGLFIYLFVWAASWIYFANV